MNGNVRDPPSCVKLAQAVVKWDTSFEGIIVFLQNSTNFPPIGGISMEPRAQLIAAVREIQSKAEAAIAEQMLKK